MLKNKNLFLVATLALFILTSCSAQTERPTVQTTEPGEEVVTEENSEATAIPLNTDESTLTWNGYKILLDTEHEGTLDISEGEFLVEDSQLVGGNFTLDISTINVIDLEGGSKDGLENHLKSADFFNLEEYSEGTFKITNVTPIQENGATHQISGNLTLKDITKNITFKANIQGLDTEEITVTADFNIDRQQWKLGEGYDQSIIDKAKDNAIQDEMRIRLDLQS